MTSFFSILHFMKPILYSYFRSSASYRVRIALHLKKIEFEYRPIHLVKDGGEQYKEEYKKLNPMSQVPSLVDGDLTLGESVAIIQYLDSKWHSPPLFPKEPKNWAPILQVCEICNSGIQPYQNVIVLNKLQSDFNANEEQRHSWARFFNERGLNSIERLVSKTAGKYAFGDQVTAADCFIIPQIFSSQRFQVDLKQFHVLSKIYENCNALEAFQKAHPAKQIDAQ